MELREAVEEKVGQPNNILINRTLKCKVVSFKVHSRAYNSLPRFQNKLKIGSGDCFSYVCFLLQARLGYDILDTGQSSRGSATYRDKAQEKNYQPLLIYIKNKGRGRGERQNFNLFYLKLYWLHKIGGNGGRRRPQGNRRRPRPRQSFNEK